MTVWRQSCDKSTVKLSTTVAFCDMSTVNMSTVDKSTVYFSTPRASLASCMLSLSLSSAQESGPMSGLAYCAGLAVYQGALNPARALGPAVVANRYFLRDLVTTHLSLFSSPLL